MNLRDRFAVSLIQRANQPAIEWNGATYTFGVIDARSTRMANALAVMIVPYVAAVSYDVCQAVPRSQREGSLALGATRWQTIWSVVLPYARPGIVGACFIALGRAIGETMAVTMLIGGSTTISYSIFGTGDSIASQITMFTGSSESLTVAG